MNCPRCDKEMSYMMSWHGHKCLCIYCGTQVNMDTGEVSTLHNRTCPDCGSRLTQVDHWTGRQYETCVRCDEKNKHGKHL